MGSSCFSSQKSNARWTRLAKWCITMNWKLAQMSATFGNTSLAVIPRMPINVNKWYISNNTYTQYFSRHYHMTNISSANLHAISAYCSICTRQIERCMFTFHHTFTTTIFIIFEAHTLAHFSASFCTWIGIVQQTLTMQPLYSMKK